MDQVADMSGLTYEERKEAWERRNELERSKRQPVDYSDVIDGSGFVDLITGGTNQMRRAASRVRTVSGDNASVIGCGATVLHEDASYD